MIGSCDPSTRGETTNSTTLQAGPAYVQIVWTWDGTSTVPNCDGPLVGVHAVNDTAASRWVHFEGRRGQPRSVELPPGTDVTRGPAWLAARGFDSYADTVGVRLTDSAVTP